MLMGWKRVRKDVKYYPVLEVDEFYTEWYTQIMKQIKVDEWERILFMSILSTTQRTLGAIANYWGYNWCWKKYS